MDQDAVTTSFEMLPEELDAVAESVKKRVHEALDANDYQAVGDINALAKQLSDFRTGVKVLQAKWQNDLSTRVAQPVGSTQPEPGSPIGLAAPPVHRYHSLWPLPGGRELLVPRLIAILERISNLNATAAPPSLASLMEWVRAEFSWTAWARNANQVCVLYTGVAEGNSEGLLRLTPEGEQLVRTRDPGIVGDALQKHVWGISEMLGWLNRRALSLNELCRAFSDIGAKRKSDHQVRERIDWLIAVGLVREERRGRSRTYVLSEPGRA